MFDEIQREAIRSEAKALLRRFSEKLANVRIEQSSERQEWSGMRRNEQVKASEADFRQRMMENAKNKEGDFIIAEKKKW